MGPFPGVIAESYVQRPPARCCWPSHHRYTHRQFIRTWMIHYARGRRRLLLLSRAVGLFLPLVRAHTGIVACLSRARVGARRPREPRDETRTADRAADNGFLDDRVVGGFPEVQRRGWGEHLTLSTHLPGSALAPKIDNETMWCHVLAVAGQPVNPVSFYPISPVPGDRTGAPCVLTLGYFAEIWPDKS